jgi:hypothetical protein
MKATLKRNLGYLSLLIIVVLLDRYLFHHSPKYGKTILEYGIVSFTFGSVFGLIVLIKNMYYNRIQYSNSGYEWRFEKSGSKFRNATYKDVYEHRNSGVSWEDHVFRFGIFITLLGLAACITAIIIYYFNGDDFKVTFKSVLLVLMMYYMGYLSMRLSKFYKPSWIATVIFMCIGIILFSHTLGTDFFNLLIDSKYFQILMRISILTVILQFFVILFSAASDESWLR